MNFNANIVKLSGTGSDLQVFPRTRYLQPRPIEVPGKSLSIGRQQGTNVLVLRGELSARFSDQPQTVHDPALFSATVLSELAASHGIKVTGAVKRDRTIRGQNPAAQVTAGKMSLVGSHETPISAVIARANKHSVNLYAEALCKRIGYDDVKATPGSWANGTAATAAYLKAAGIPESDFTLADGCGLSKKNAISPRALVRVLCYEFYSKNHDIYLQSLSVAGVDKDGTLEKRFAGSDLRRRVFGKSGFVEGVSTLSGYLQARDGQWYAFSIMINGIPRLSNSEIKLLQERIVKAVDAEVSKK
jgi:D-alanyl-D-alanine carboxypeptidase/D-alanyl-D-alanine-endopeptidase (penicillin-binding protein 4)